MLNFFGGSRKYRLLSNVTLNQEQVILGEEQLILREERCY